MATRRSRLQIKPNIGPKSKGGPLKPGPDSKATTEVDDPKAKSRPLAEANDAKVRSRPTLSLQSPQSVNKDGPLSPRKNLANETKKPTDVVDGHNVEGQKEINKSEITGKTAEEEKGEVSIARKRKFQPNLNVSRKPQIESEDVSKVKGPASPLKSVKFNIIPAEKKVVEQSESVKEKRESEDVNDGEKDTENRKKQKQRRRNEKPSIPADAPLDRTKMKMSDLIHWNPSRNFMAKKTPKPQSSNSTSQDKNVNSKDSTEDPTSNPLLQATEEEGRVDDPEAEAEAEEVEGEEALPVPQVKIGPDGSLILNEESLVIPNKDKVVDESNARVIDETDSMTTYSSFRKQRKRSLWTEKQTERFYKALRCIGTDFTLMRKVFPKRTRTELKKKFSKEDRENRAKLEKALDEKLPFDLSLLEEEDEEDEKEKKEKAKKKEGREKKPRGRPPNKPNKDVTDMLATYLKQNQNRDITIKAGKSATPGTPSAPRTSKRKWRKTTSYYEETEDQGDADENDVNNAVPVAKRAKGKTVQKKTPGTEAPQEPSQIPSQLLNSAGSNITVSNTESGPLVLLYNQASSGNGEIVIHVYRLQPEMGGAEPDVSMSVMPDANNPTQQGEKSTPSQTLQLPGGFPLITSQSDTPTQPLPSHSDKSTPTSVLPPRSNECVPALPLAPQGNNVTSTPPSQPTYVASNVTHPLNNVTSTDVLVEQTGTWHPVLQPTVSSAGQIATSLYAVGENVTISHQELPQGASLDPVAGPSGVTDPTRHGMLMGLSNASVFGQMAAHSEGLYTQAGLVELPADCENTTVTVDVNLVKESS